MAGIILVAVFFLALLALAFLVWQAIQKIEGLKSREESLALFQQQIESLRVQVSSSLTDSQKLVEQKMSGLTAELSARLSDVSRQLLSSQDTVSQRLDKATAVVGEVQRSLGTLGQQSQRILEVGQNISSLQEILRAPKLRGILGELFLGELLSQILPPAHYGLQHRFKSGETVDAVVRVGDHLVPVDAKFPLENFKRVLDAGTDEERKAARRKFVSDVKKHVDAIADKYILPDEGTYDFALMYIPAENVYYETILKDEAFGEDKSLSAHALERRVIPVSPNSIFAYLQVIALGLRGLKVEEQARMILEHLSRLQGELAKFTEAFERVGTHLGNAQKAYGETEKRLLKLEDKLASLGRGESALPAPDEPAVPQLKV